MFEVKEEQINVWRVMSEDKIYMVSKNHVQNPSCCELKCASCNICIHTYGCTCVDYFVKATICNHIHFVNMLKHNNIMEKKNYNLLSTSSNSCNNDNNEIDLNLKTLI